MLRTGVLCLSLIALPLLAGEPQRLRRSGDEAVPVLSRQVQATAVKAILVDCSKGESVQQAIEKNPGTIEISIRGQCVENVVIDTRDVTLRGTDPAADGIRSASTVPAVAILWSNSSRLEKLSFSDNPGTAVQILYSSNVAMADCVFNGNNGATGPGTGALIASRDSFVDATHLTFTNGHRRGIIVQRDALVLCRGCEFSSNGGYALTANRGGIGTLLNSTVAQLAGIVANGAGSYADIDCVSDPYVHPCSMQVTGNASFAANDGETSLYGAGDFTGRVIVDRATGTFYGARQTSMSGTNSVSNFGKLSVNPSYDVEPPLTSRVMSTAVSGFARMLITEQATLDGTIACGAAGDAWIDPSLVALAGSAVSGCEHASLP